MEKALRVLKWEKGIKCDPVDVEIYPTNFCNLRCRFCGTKPDPAKKEFTNEQWLSIIKEIMSTDVKRLYFLGGGEPLMKRELFQTLFKRVKKGNKFFSIVTNFTLLDRELIEEFVKFGWDDICISLDGTEDLHDFHRGRKGVFKIVKKNIQQLQSFKKERGAKVPEIRLHTVLTCYNYDQLDRIIEFAHEQGIQLLELDSLDTANESVKYLEIKKSQLQRFQTLLKRYIRLLERYKIKHNYENFLENRFTFRGNNTKPKENKNNHHPLLQTFCFLPWIKIVISPYGEVTPCCVGFGSSEVGSFENSFEYTWKDSNYFTRLRENMKRGEHPNFCNHCAPELIKETLWIKEWIRNEM